MRSPAPGGTFLTPGRSIGIYSYLQTGPSTSPPLIEIVEHALGVGPEQTSRLRSPGEETGRHPGDPITRLKLTLIRGSSVRLVATS
jgi:hypothetical protein